MRSDKKQRLWVISEPYYPEETSTGYYLTRIAEGLAGDFDVKVLCGQPNYSARGTVAPKREVHKGVEMGQGASPLLAYRFKEKWEVPLGDVRWELLGDEA